MSICVSMGYTGKQTVAQIGRIVMKFRHADLEGAIGGYPGDIKGYQRV